VGKTVGIKLRYEDFQTVTRDLTLREPTDDPQTIRRAAGECLKRVPLGKRLRLLGVRLSTLTPIDDWKAEHPPSPQAELFLETVPTL
jgi:DNA polymerase-4